MANNCDHKLITSSNTNRNKLLKLAEGIKTRKKGNNHSISGSNRSDKYDKYDRALTNIEHLVFGTYKSRPTSPAAIGSITPITSVSPTSDANDSIDCECSLHSVNGKSVAKVDTKTNDSQKWLISGIERLTTNESPNRLANHSKIPQPIANKCNTSNISNSCSSGRKSLSKSTGNSQIPRLESYNCSNNTIKCSEINSYLNKRSVADLQLLNTNTNQLWSLGSLGININKSSDLNMRYSQNSLTKRNQILYKNSLRRHNSLLETNYKYLRLKSIQNNYRLTKELANNTNVSQITNSYQTFSAETRKTSLSKYDTNEVNKPNSDLFESSKTQVIKIKSNTNLQRNRPQVKCSSTRIRMPLKIRSNSVPDSKPLPTIESTINRSSSDSTQSKTEMNSKFMKMFVMDESEDNIEEKHCSSDLDNQLYINYLRNSLNERNSFQQIRHEIPIMSFKDPTLRPSFSSEYQISDILLSRAQKKAIDGMKGLSKTGRPWSHIYTESEAKHVLNVTKPLVGINKQKSENDILSTNISNNQNLVLGSTQTPTALDNSSIENVLQKFKKTFSLRFSKNTNNQTKLNTSGLSDEKHQILAVNGSDSGHQIKDQINNTNKAEDMSESKNSIKSREQTYRKSIVRKQSNRRLKRSLSHPHNFEKWSNFGKNNLRQNNSKASNEVSDNESECKPNGNQLSKQESESDVTDDVIYAEALWDHTSLDPEELSFKAGELIDISDSSDKDWWWGSINVDNEQRCGWFPASFVRMRVSQDDTLEECIARTGDNTVSRTPKKRLSISKLSNQQIRANVVLEIINTERDFVKNLKDVIDGYLTPCRRRTDMFSELRINTIFSNIEQLYEFQRNFLNELELSIDLTHISNTLIGDSFLINENNFIVYCEFCKNHPLAISELQDLYSDDKYVVFFEGCRLIQNMIDISLDGFLLTPIQKICKYPLQLAELLKYTPTEHKDFIPVKNAYACMQRVAQLVNETKRRFESLEQLIAIQESFDGWEGPDLMDTSSILIHSGEVHRLINSWTKDVVLFLFDNLLVFGKKESGILKRSNYTYKNRIDMDSVTAVVDIEDGTKGSNFNIIAKNCFKLFSDSNQKWYYFQTKTLKDKQNWIKAFVDERQRVAEDKRQAFVVTEKDKKSAQMAHINSLKPKKPRVKRVAKSRKPDTAVTELALDGPNHFEIDRNRAGSLPSYMHSDKSFLNGSKMRQSVNKKATNRSNWFHLGSTKKSKTRIKRTLK